MASPGASSSRPTDAGLSLWFRFAVLLAVLALCVAPWPELDTDDDDDDASAV